MPSSPSPLLKVELQAAGENADTWGDKANVAFGVLIENAIAKRASVATNHDDYHSHDVCGGFRHSSQY